MARGINFTESQQKEMIDMYQQGHGLVYVAAQFYSTAGTIRNILIQNGIALRGRGGFEINVSQKLIKKAVDMYQSGYTIDAVAKSVGYSGTTIRKWLMENGVRIRARNPVENKRIAQSKNVKKASEVIIGEPIDCDTQGKRCIYRSKDENRGLCDYCSIVGRCRGGSPHECTKYKFPEKKKRVK